VVNSAALGQYRQQVEERLRSLEQEGFARRLWAKDATLWESGEAEQRAIENRLGWLGAAGSVLEHCDRLRAFATEVKEAGFRRAVLLGMGGSSLAPEVFQRTFGPAPGDPDLVVLDTTDPAAILAVGRDLDLARTLFIVSSKSGTTTETSSLYRYFFEKVRALKGPRAGENFVAITDPDTPLERLAGENGFRRCYLNAADIVDGIRPSLTLDSCRRPSWESTWSACWTARRPSHRPARPASHPRTTRACGWARSWVSWRRRDGTR
jgi:transaldolase/glucose-6-phosphate isomerase